MAHTKNMTEGKPFPIIVAYFIPILCSTVFQQLYSIIDTIIVGKGISDLALAAVGSSGAVTFFIFGFIMGLTSGMAVLTAQAFGSGDHAKLRQTIAMGILACGSVALVVMSVSMAVIRPALAALNTSPKIIDDAVLYVMIILAGVPLTLSYNCLGAILNSLGDSRTPLIAVLISSGINVVLDLFFIMVCGMGVEGAAIATLIAQGCASVFCFMKIKSIPYLHLSSEDWKLDWHLIIDVFRIGIPVAFMNSITAIGCLLLQYFVNAFGENYTAAYAACIRIQQFMMQPCQAVGMTMSTYAGQNLGAGRVDRIVEGLKKSSILSLIIIVICTGLLLFVPETLAGLMLSDAENIKLSADYLRICGAMIWSLAVMFVVRSTCQGMGKTFIPMLSGVAEMAARVIIVLLLHTALGFASIALAETGAWSAALLLNGVFLVIHLRKLLRN